MAKSGEQLVSSSLDAQACLKLSDLLARMGGKVRARHFRYVFEKKCRSTGSGMIKSVFFPPLQSIVASPICGGQPVLSERHKLLRSLESGV